MRTPAEAKADPTRELEDLWAEAVAACGSKLAVMRAYIELYQPEPGFSVTSITADVLREPSRLHQPDEAVQDGGGP